MIDPHAPWPERHPFDEAFDDALDGYPQIISQHGKPKCVLISHEQWTELKRLAGIADRNAATYDGGDNA